MIFLANEVLEKTILYPLSIGWLVVIAGVGMFFGSTYLLLATNVGSRLGFLIVGSVVTAFLCVLSLLWMTTATPLNVFKGRVEEWKPLSINNTAKSSKTIAVQDIENSGTKITGAEYANIKAAADTILAPALEGTEKPESIAADLPSKPIVVTDIYRIGGSTANPLHLEFKHKPLYAVAIYCPLDEIKSKTAFRNTCETPLDGKTNTKVLVLEKDLGSLRQPPTFLFLGSFILCIIFLLNLHWREQDTKPEEVVNGDIKEDEEKEKVDA
ncbi:MAG: hypothetical protein KBF89_01820 [Acidimicrobiia bacterium]|nr:hypothetical protein [Acidimicrobiia bacterium]